MSHIALIYYALAVWADPAQVRVRFSEKRGKQGTA
jgi:hypothetical protein